MCVARMIMVRFDEGREVVSVFIGEFVIFIGTGSTRISTLGVVGSVGCV